MKNLTALIAICLILAGLFTLMVGYAQMPNPQDFADLWPSDQEEQYPPYPEPDGNGWDWETWEGGGEMDGRGTQPSLPPDIDPDYVPPEGEQNYPLVTILGLSITAFDIIGLLLVVCGIVLLLTEGKF